TPGANPPGDRARDMLSPRRDRYAVRDDRQSGIHERNGRHCSDGDSVTHAPITLLRFLDLLQSSWNQFNKGMRFGLKYGRGWRDKVRTGRRYSRVERHEAGEFDDSAVWFVRDEPGWEWRCQNCKAYSIITASMLPVILETWKTERAD